MSVLSFANHNKCFFFCFHFIWLKNSICLYYVSTSKSIQFNLFFCQLNENLTVKPIQELVAAGVVGTVLAGADGISGVPGWPDGKPGVIGWPGDATAVDTDGGPPGPCCLCWRAAACIYLVFDSSSSRTRDLACWIRCHAICSTFADA